MGLLWESKYVFYVFLSYYIYGAVVGEQICLFMSFCLNIKGLLSCLSLLSNNTTCRKLVNYLRIWKIRCNFATANCGTMY